MCKSDGRDEVSPRAVGRHPGLDAPYKGEPLTHQGAPADIYSEAANSVQREARAGLQAAANTCGATVSRAEQGGVRAILGPKCLVAGCNNRFGEGVFHGELCAPCHRMLITGHVSDIGTTFVHGIAGTLARQNRTPQELRNASLNLLNDLAPTTRRDAWWDTQGPSYIMAKHLEKYHEKGQS